MYTTQIDIDLSGERAPTVVYAKQGDVSARQLDIGFIDNGSVYGIPDGTTARIWIKKPDGTAVYNEATISGDRVLVELTSQALIVAGDARAEIALYQGDELLSSSVFVIRIEHNARSESAAESSNEFGTLDKLIQEAKEVIAGSIDQKTVTFIESSARENISSGETGAILFGKIKKWFSDLASGAASTLLGQNLSASRVLISNAGGKVTESTVTDEELSYLSGTISNVQGQIGTLSNLQTEDKGSLVEAVNWLKDNTDQSFKPLNDYVSTSAKLVSLWTNTGSNFVNTGMTIPVENVQKYDMFLIASAGDPVVLAGFDGCIGAIRTLLNDDADTYDLVFARRPVTVNHTAGGIVFGAATYRIASAGGGLTTDNTRCIPYRIYGVIAK